MSANITLRLFGMLLFASAGLLLGMYLSSLIYGSNPNGFNELVLPVTIFSALVGLLVTPYITIYPLRWIRNRLKAMPAGDLVALTIGLFVGLLLGALISWPLSNLPGWAGQVIPTLVTLVLAYLGGYTATLHKGELTSTLRRGPTQADPLASPNPGKSQPIESIFTTGPLHLGHTGELKRPEITPSDKYLLVDTSAIIDGRIADISRTGFLDGTLLVPRFVLNELQHIADSPDALRRARGRRGLDMLNRLQKESVVPIQISEIDAEEISEVDGKLIKIARTYRCAVVTTDFNLNRVAEIQGVRVLNINELANAVKPVVLPGEEMNVHVIQEGKELGQGVGYLDDGTMVVVENGKKYINADVEVTVTRVLQTVAGRMIFAQMKNGRH